MASISVLTKKQTKQYGPRPIAGYGRNAMITAEVRWDDSCGNGHNSFAITGEVGRQAYGCLHDDIAKVFPELKPFLKWHLCSSDGPMHYIENTVYHVDEHGPNMAFVYCHGGIDPLQLGGNKERLLGYLKEAEARKCEGVDGYRVEWDEKTSKARNLDAARLSAAWPDATDDDLILPGLQGRLEARLPALLEEFQAAVESLGFVW